MDIVDALRNMGLAPCKEGAVEIERLIAENRLLKSLYKLAKAERDGLARRLTELDEVMTEVPVSAEILDEAVETLWARHRNRYAAAVMTAAAMEMRRMADEIARLIADRDALKSDAERLDWLEKHKSCIIAAWETGPKSLSERHFSGWVCTVSGEQFSERATVREAIDAARSTGY